MLGDFRTLHWGLFEYRVPQGARVEVWDSGIKAHAIAEDTPEAVAERYGVPT